MNYLRENLDVIKCITGVLLTVILILVFIFFKTVHRRKRIFYLNKSQNISKDNVFDSIFPGLYIRNNHEIIPVNISYDAKTGKLIKNSSVLSENLIYIVGEGGTGKSTFTNYLYNNLLQSKKANALYVPIKRLKCDESATVKRPVFDYVYNNDSIISNVISLDLGKIKFDSSIKNWNQLLNLLTKHSTLYIFIDGYDEIVYNKITFDIIDEEIREIISANNTKVKLIISSRNEPKLNLDAQQPTVLYVDKLTDKQKKSYLGENAYNNLNDEIKEIISTPLLLSMYKATCCELINNENDELNGYIVGIKTATDIYWNNYCYYWKKIEDGLQGNVDSKVVFAKYIIPFIAYNLEYKKIESNFTINDIDSYTKEFLKNFDFFKQIFRFNCDKEDIEKLLQSNDFEKHYLSELSIIEHGMNGGYKFSHLMHKNFFAAVYEYYKDYCILQTDYSSDGIEYKPYKLLDDKVTIHTITRVFYSNLIARLVDDRQSSDFLNKPKYHAIISDLYYYGDSKTFPQNRDLALQESYNGFDCCRDLDEDKIDGLSKKWLAWNFAFIIFDGLLIKNKDEEYTEDEIRNAKYAVNALKYAMKYNYVPAYDKFARIYVTSLFDNFKKYSILCKEDIPKDNEKLDKAKSLLEKSCQGNYHFSYNSYGYLLEKEGKLNDAYEKYKKSVECDPLDFYARARCGLYLIHNFDRINSPLVSSNKKEYAYREAEKILKDGYTYYSAIKYDKPYELKGIDTLISNLAEYYLILYYQYKSIPLNESIMYLNNACDYYTVLFNIYDKACENKQKTYDQIFNNSNNMRDVLCYCLSRLILKNKHEVEIVTNSILKENFNELCQIVYDYYEKILKETKKSTSKNPFLKHPVFHFERFEKYYNDFVKLYNN